MNPKNNSNLDLKKAKIVSIRTYFSFFVSTLSLFISCNAPKLYNPCDVSSVSLSKTVLMTAIFGSQASFCGKSSSTNATFDKPSLLNVRENGIISSGFLIGTASSSAARVEVSIDNGQFETATGTSTWKFKLPSGSSTFKSYSKHLISVRAVSSNEVKSDLFSINARKGNNQDVNGDGYADVAIGAYGYGTNNGRVYLFLSQGSNGFLSSANSTATTIITGTATGLLGVSEVLGDFNGDGYADLAVGAQNAVSNGRVYIFYSTGGTGIASGNDTSASKTISGNASGDQFGYYLAAGDCNGDGYADLAVGAPAASSNFGAAYIFHSSGSGGIAQTTAATANSTLTGSVSNGYLGNVELGDLNGDGYDDLVTGAYGSSPSGKVFVFHSTGSTGVANASDASAVTTLSGTGASTQFGKSVSIGDIDGDGYLDVAVGAPVSGNGKSFVFRSTGSSGIASNNDSAAFNTITSATTGSQLGASVSIADMNGDGNGDLATGANGASGGFAYVFRSVGSAGIGNFTDAGATAILTGTNASGGFGYALFLGDFNGDGFADLVSGAYAVSSNKGASYYFASAGTSGILTASDSAANAAISSSNANENFGLSVR